MNHCLKTGWNNAAEKSHMVPFGLQAVLFLNRIEIGQKNEEQCQDRGEEREQGPYHLEHGIGDGRRVYDGIAKLVIDHVRPGQTKEHGDEGTGDCSTELLGHRTRREDESRRGGAVLLSGIVGHVGIHRPHQRRIDANACRGEDAHAYHQPDILRIHRDEEEDKGRHKTDNAGKHESPALRKYI